MLGDAFRAESFEVHLAGDALAMLRIVQRMEIDIIALDIGLPGMDGMEAASPPLRRPESHTSDSHEEESRRLFRVLLNIPAALPT